MIKEILNSMLDPIIEPPHIFSSENIYEANQHGWNDKIVQKDVAFAVPSNQTLEASLSEKFDYFVQRNPKLKEASAFIITSRKNDADYGTVVKGDFIKHTDHTPIAKQVVDVYF